MYRRRGRGKGRYRRERERRLERGRDWHGTQIDHNQVSKASL